MRYCSAVVYDWLPKLFSIGTVMVVIVIISKIISLPLFPPPKHLLLLLLFLLLFHICMYCIYALYTTVTPKKYKMRIQKIRHLRLLFRLQLCCFSGCFEPSFQLLHQTKFSILHLPLVPEPPLASDANTASTTHTINWKNDDVWVQQRHNIFNSTFFCFNNVFTATSASTAAPVTVSRVMCGCAIDVFCITELVTAKSSKVDLIVMLCAFVS